MLPELRHFARHVVKFRDGTYLGPRLLIHLGKSKSVPHKVSQQMAQPWLTWACAKLMAESVTFKCGDDGARAVKLTTRKTKARRT